ncbi:hypothetical protein C8J56DRAFT_1160384 [Mycena floridula]|nr:hypothetical protein C8J56DRAFT_1160384 [Mycena floridula]
MRLDFSIPYCAQGLTYRRTTAAAFDVVDDGSIRHQRVFTRRTKGEANAKSSSETESGREEEPLEKIISFIFTTAAAPFLTATASGAAPAPATAGSQPYLTKQYPILHSNKSYSISDKPHATNQYPNETDETRRLIRAHQTPRRASKSTFHVRRASSLNRSITMATTTNPPTPDATLGLDAHLVTTDALHSFHPLSPYTPTPEATGASHSASSYLNCRNGTTSPTSAIFTAAAIEETLIGEPDEWEQVSGYRWRLW